MNTSIIKYKGEQLEIDFDRPAFSICPNCSSQIIKLADGCGICGWSEDKKLLGGNSSLKQRVSVARCDIKWAQQLVTEHHYLHRPIHPRSLPFAYSISFDNEIIGTIIMAIPHFPKKGGLFGYPDLPTKWQVLQIARLWIDPKYQGKQSNGHASNIASCAIAKMLKRVNQDWLEHHPPKYSDQPYNIELIISYADTGAGHQGTIYKAANFQRWGETTNNRPRHGLSKGSKEPKILYIYRLKQKLKSSLLDSQVLLGGNKNSPLQEDRKRSSLKQNISLPCTISQPNQPELKGVIQQDLGDRFTIYIPSDGSTITVSKLLVYPDFSSVGQIPPTRKAVPPSTNCSNKQIPPTVCEAVSFRKQVTPPSKIRRKKGEGTGYIYRRTITRRGKQYPESYYRYRDESGKLKAKYIPQRLLDRVEEAESRKLPVADVLKLLGGDGISRGEQSSTLEVQNNDENSQSNSISRGEQTIPPSTKRRKQGYGTGYIECKPIKRGGNEYKQYWYHYEEWREGDRITKKSQYIPKKMENKIIRMNNEKVQVAEILKVLKSRGKRKK